MNWNSLIFGSYSRDQIQKAVADPEWQVIREELVGEPLRTKYARLLGWLAVNDYSERSKIQVSNYVNALKRGGLISLS